LIFASYSCCRFDQQRSITSRNRIKRDKDAALKIGSAFDAASNLPIGLHLDDILDPILPNRDRDDSPSKDYEPSPALLQSKVIPKKNGTVVDPKQEGKACCWEGMLDIAITYLRRVHLFSFYSGSYGLWEGGVQLGLSLVGTIHLRLHNANVILADTAAKSREPVKRKECLPASNTLVQRLNE